MTGRHTVTFITDELKSSHDAALDFARAEALGTVELRSVDGRNILAMSDVEVAELAQHLRNRGLAVAGLASPLLKWPAPGRIAAREGDQFGFVRAGRSLAQLGRLTAERAHALGTRNVRIFTYLTHDNFQLEELFDPLDELLDLAEREDLVFHVENEPVCNIQRGTDLLALLRHYNHPRLRALLDIGNVYYAGVEPKAAELAAVMPYVDHMHFKDYADRRYVALGEGRIPYRELLSACLQASDDRALTMSVETHVPDDQPEATRRSLACLRALLDAVQT